MKRLTYIGVRPVQYGRERPSRSVWGERMPLPLELDGKKSNDSHSVYNLDKKESFIFLHDFINENFICCCNIFFVKYRDASRKDKVSASRAI